MPGDRFWKLRSCTGTSPLTVLVDKSLGLVWIILELGRIDLVMGDVNNITRSSEVVPTLVPESFSPSFG